MVIKAANLGLRFLLELCVLGALGYWGFTVSRGLVAKIGLGIGAPLLIAVVWGALGAPGAEVKLPGPLHLLLEVVVFGSGAVALFAANRPALAGWLALVIVMNRTLMFVWGQ